MTKEQLMEAFKLSCPIRYYDEARNKEGIYQILAIGKSQDDSGTWHESVTYTDGEETYTRYVKNFSDKFSMLKNKEVGVEECRNFSLNIEIRDGKGFKPISHIISNAMKNYDNRTLPFAVSAASHSDELSLLDKVEDHIRKINAYEVLEFLEEERDKMERKNR